MTTASEAYYKVGNGILDDFLFFDLTRTRVTGKVQGDFTLRLTKNGTGNQSTTGITLTEISAANDPGWYHVDVSGTTGFPAATGVYTLEIFLTSDNRLVWAKTFRVTSDGTGAGTTGPVSFTATAADGRVVSSAVALAGATVLIKRSTGAIYTSFTSDASGLWGPVYFTDADTYTISVFKSGFTTSNTSTITVTGSPASSAVGPLADISLSATSSGSGLTFSDLIAYARRMARNSTGTQADTEIKECVNDALSMICQDHLWPHYKSMGDFALEAEYSTGAVTVTSNSTTVTLAAGTWPTNAASYKLFVGGQVHRVASRTSGTDIVLATAFRGTTAAGQAFRLFRDEYSLPSDCMKFGTLLPGINGLYGTATPVGLEQILLYQSDYTFSQRFPACWAIHARSGTDLIQLYPAPTTDILLPFWYYRRPATLVSSSEEADWMAGHVQLLHRAIDLQVALHYASCVAGDLATCKQSYKDALALAIGHDQTAVRQTPAISSTSGMLRNPLGTFRITT